LEQIRTVLDHSLDERTLFSVEPDEALLGVGSQLQSQVA
jgi:hypothetical protein